MASLSKTQRDVIFIIFIVCRGISMGKIDLDHTKAEEILKSPPSSPLFPFCPPPFFFACQILSEGWTPRPLTKIPGSASGLSSWLAEQEVRGSIPRLATWNSEIGYLLLPTGDMAEISLKRRKSSKQHRCHQELLVKPINLSITDENRYINVISIILLLILYPVFSPQIYDQVIHY